MNIYKVGETRKENTSCTEFRFLYPSFINCCITEVIQIYNWKLDNKDKQEWQNKYYISTMQRLPVSTLIYTIYTYILPHMYAIFNLCGIIPCIVFLPLFNHSPTFHFNKFLFDLEPTPCSNVFIYFKDVFYIWFVQTLSTRAHISSRC